MAKLKERELALAMRKKGMSYSQIKSNVKVSKSTLHYWLKDHPLSAERIRELRDWNEVRIEKCRDTKEKKRIARQGEVYKKLKKQIGTLSKRELFIAGLFLYWGEGTKTARYTVALTNTDPSMLNFFLTWLRLLHVDEDKIKVRLHLYNDMDPEKQIQFWSDTLGLPKSSFRKPYIKDNPHFKRKGYKGRFGHGTCSIVIIKRDLEDMVTAGLKILREKYL